MHCSFFVQESFKSSDILVTQVTKYAPRQVCTETHLKSCQISFKGYTKISYVSVCRAVI